MCVAKQVEHQLHAGNSTGKPAMGREAENHQSFPSSSCFAPQAASPILLQHDLFCPFGTGLVQGVKGRARGLLFLRSKGILLRT